MKFTNENNALTLFFEGEVNSYNAENIEKELSEVLEKETFEKLVLDFAHLRYISSAGLRIVLKLKQKYNNVSIVEASLEVFDILNMTGFTNILEVKKALNRVYIGGAEIVGEGYNSTVYRLGKDTILKVFNRLDDVEEIEKELRLAKEAFILGIPTAISFDIVKVDDKYGVRFEMFDCDSLKNIYVKHPEKSDELLKKYVDLLHKINSVESYNKDIPNIKKKYISQLNEIKDSLPKESFDKALRLLESVPDRDTLIHGDCHFKNIMVQNDEYLLIDMDTLSVGHPIFELAALRSAYITYNEYDPGDSSVFFGVDAEISKKLYEDLINCYFGENNQAKKDKIAILSIIHVLRAYIVKDFGDEKAIKESKATLIDLLNKYDDLDIGI